MPYPANLSGGMQTAGWQLPEPWPITQRIADGIELFAQLDCATR